jgi:hypothetical protein
VTQSRCAAAFVLFVILNLAMPAFIHVQRYEDQAMPWYPDKTRPWWSLRSFESKKQHPIVLMGSSLMMCASDCADALAFRSIESKCWAHPCRYLTSKLRTEKPVDNFCFALPGQCASDAWCIAQTAFINSRVPKAIIYGISPADFMNTSFRGPTHTETFKLMHHVGDCSDVEHDGIHRFWDRFNFELEHRIWLYRHQTDVWFAIRQVGDLIESRVLHEDLSISKLPLVVQLQFSLTSPGEFFENDPKPDFSQYSNVKDIINGKSVPLLRVEAQQVNTRPSAASKHEPLTSTCRRDGKTHLRTACPAQPQQAALVQGLSCYRSVFSSFDNNSYQEQMLCLRRLAVFCRQNNIALVLVNMPVSAEHVGLIVPSRYGLYLNDVQKIADSTGAQFTDLYDPCTFPTNLFIDSNHLNPAGATKFWDVLIPKLQKQLSLAN